MSWIEVEGKRYRVEENLGHQGGYQARAVMVDSVERIAIKRNGKWVWWTAADRLDNPPKEFSNAK